MFQFELVPTRNKPKRITKDTIYALDGITRNSIVDQKFKTAILTTALPDHSFSLYPWAG